MSDYGLRVWNAAGVQTLDTDTKLSRLLGSVTTTSGVNGSVTAEFSSGTPWFQILISGKVGFINAPSISISGSTLTWTYTGNASYMRPVTIIYGVY